METIMYTIKSTSDEGVYFLVNHWEKHKAFWKEKNKLKSNMLFKREQDAKRSLTQLLKIMEDYRNDTFELVEVTIDGVITCIINIQPLIINPYICASALLKEDKIYVGKRHSDIFTLMPIGFLRNAEQGFLTNEGNFVNRKEALKIAIKNGQAQKKENSDELFSEDLWFLEEGEFNGQNIN